MTSFDFTSKTACVAIDANMAKVLLGTSNLLCEEFEGFHIVESERSVPVKYL